MTKILPVQLQIGAIRFLIFPQIGKHTERVETKITVRDILKDNGEAFFMDARQIWIKRLRICIALNSLE